jgi:DNA-binding LacI/PurR family transcriptional regulator
MDTTPRHATATRNHAKYRAVARELQALIEAGEFADQLPGTTTLARRFHVTPVTLHKALRLLKEHGYVYAVPGRGTYVCLRRRPLTRMIGGLFHTTAGAPLHHQLIDGIHRAARTARRGTTFEQHDGDPGRELQLARDMLEQNRVDGFILWPSESPRRTLDLLRDRHVPFVVVPEPDLTTFADCHTVSNDDSGAAGSLVGHLVGLGHRRIGFFADERLAREAPSFFVHRRERYERVLSESGLPVLDTLITPPAWGEGLEAGPIDTDLLEGLRELTAAVCITDDVALEVFRHCAAAGIRIPDELAVTGYDNSEFARRLGITSVEQHFDLIGETALQILVDDLDHRTDGPVHANVPSELILRQSTLGAPRRAASAL